MNLFRLLCFSALLACSSLLHGQVIINEVQYVGTDQVELKNVGTTTINVSSWWFCNLFVYNQLSSLTATGSLNMAPGDIVVVTGFSLNNSASDLGLYNSASFGSATAMEDFVQWGGGGLGRENVAVNAGIWTAGDFVPTVAGASSSIEFDGCSSGIAAWAETTTPSFGAENSNLVAVDGGTVSYESGPDTAYYCIAGTGGGMGMLAFDSTTTATESYAYVVTDPNGVILALPPGDMADFTPAPIGECWIWGLSYSGTVTAQVGDNATTTALSDGCFDLSDNFVVIFRDSVDGGTVSSPLGDTVSVCINDPSSAVLSFDSTGTFGPNFAYVVTDNAGNILGLPPGDMVDFSGAGIGECWVWGLSYSGNVLAQVGDNAAMTALTDGCYDLSDNFVVVFRDSVEGGTVSTNLGEDTVYYCISGTGGGTGVVEISNTASSAPNYVYVVTDPAGNIVGLPPANMVDVTPAGIGECWVWGLAYSGTLLAQVGDNATQIDLSDGCFDLSDNFVVIFRDSLDGGDVLTDVGEDTVNVCINDPSSATLAFASSNAAGPNFAYVVTDNMGNILGLPPGNTVDFSGAGIGECWVWGLSYTGNVLAQVGDNAGSVTLTDGCYDLSDEFVVVFRDSVDGGTVSTQMGMDTVYICLTDTGANAGVMRFDSLDAFGPNFAYVVTDPTTQILGLPPGDMVDFSGAGVGECWVWGLSFTGNATASVGDVAGEIDLSDGCFDLSDNFVVVFRDTTGEACGIVGIDDALALEQLSVYPNPAQNLLNISFSTASSNARETDITVYNAAGQAIIQRSEVALPTATQDIKLNVSDLSQGMYFLVIQHGERISSQRFVRE